MWAVPAPRSADTPSTRRPVAERPAAAIVRPQPKKEGIGDGGQQAAPAGRSAIDCAFAGRRIVIFYGGAAVFDDDKPLHEIRSIHAGGGFGSIIGRNSSQRRKEEAIRMLGTTMDIYASPAAFAGTH
jgi:class I fructose-bisphosphate aldolase